MNTKFDELVRNISRIDSSLSEAIHRLENQWQTGESDDTELTEMVSNMLLSCADQGLFSVETMVKGYKAFANDFTDRQTDYLRSGSYRAKDYESIREAVYSNDEYMISTYYPALLLSYIASPNYRQILRSLKQTLANWKICGVNRILDIASGHGFLLLYALEMLPKATGHSVDLSPMAARFSDSLQKITGWGEARFSYQTIDLLVARPDQLSGPYDAALCCELLEHIPNPEILLRQIHTHFAPQGRLFISAAVRMESVDHLTLFKSTEEVTQMIEREGFDVLETMSVPFVGQRPENPQKWARLLSNARVSATYIAECTARSR